MLHLCKSEGVKCVVAATATLFMERGCIVEQWPESRLNVVGHKLSDSRV